MSQQQNKTIAANDAKGWFSRFEAAALVLILALSALRLSFIEDLHNRMLTPGQWMTPRGMSLMLTATLAAVLFLWFLAGLLRGRIVWRCSGLGWGALLFFAAGATAVFGASDKRTAMTDAATLAVPMAAAWAAAIMLDSRQRVRTLLWVIIAMGCAAVYQSVDQYMSINAQMIEDYERGPQKHLETLGIEPKSLAHWQYEHRLYSKDVRGFLTTSNSTGTFLLLAIFAAAGLLAESGGRKNTSSGTAAAVLYGMVVCVLLAGLIVCKSRGAIAAGCFAAIVFFVLLLFGHRLWRIRRMVLLCIGAAGALIIAATVWYGIRHGRLPGPNAMLVRWQYWTGAAGCIAEHPLVGVGGGNFRIFYPQYKIAAAPETVRDPHNFLLALLAQYGPLGLAAVLASLTAGFWKGLRGCCQANASLEQNLRQKGLGADLLTLAAVLAALLFIRPMLEAGDIPQAGAIEYQAAYVVLYLIQAGCFAMAFILMWAADEPAQRDGKQQLRLGAGLLGGTVAVAVHNLIDFGIFEPGVWMSFWLVLAAAASTSLNRGAGGGFRVVRISGKTTRLSLGAAATLLFAVWLWFVVITPVRAQRLIARATSEPAEAIKLLEKSGRIDALDPDGLHMAAMLDVGRYKEAMLTQQGLLEDALHLALQAQGRDLHNVRYPILLSGIYQLFADKADDAARWTWLEKAYEAGLEAQRLYPGSDIAAFSLGQLAEKTDRKDEAVKHYRRAVQIEQQYRRQFELMYPGQEIFSRLGQEHYEYGLEYLRQYGGEN